MKKIILILIICFALAGVTLALDECGRAVPTGTNCSIISTHLSSGACSGSYWLNITYSNGTAHTSNGSFSQIADTGIFNHSAYFPVASTYVVKQCDNAVRTIVVFDIAAAGESASWWTWMMQIFYNTLPGAW